MRVAVKLFASLTQYAPGIRAGTPFEVELPEGARVEELLGQIGVPAGAAKVVFVNGRSRPDDWRLAPDDEIGIFPHIGGGSVPEMQLDVWLYGVLARYGGAADRGSYANPAVRLSEGSTVGDLLAYLGMPTAERGITFINGGLSAMPGLQPDLKHVLSDGDRVAFFDLRSMWPFQYRHGAALAAEMSAALESRPDHGTQHAYTAPGPESEPPQ